MTKLRQSNKNNPKGRQLESTPITRESTPITKKSVFNNIRSINTHKDLSWSQKKSAFRLDKLEFIEALKARIQEQQRAKFNPTPTQKRRRLAKVRRKRIAKIQNTQEKETEQQKYDVKRRLENQAAQKPVQTREQAMAENQEASSSSGIDALGTKFAAAISTVATINTIIPRELGETISVQDINSVTDSVENETRLNARNLELSRELKNNIKNLMVFDRELKRGLSNAKCEVGKKCFTNKNDVTPKNVIDKLEKAYAEIGDNNKALKGLLKEQCGTISCFDEKDRNLKTNKDIKEAVIRRITELQKLREKEKETSAKFLVDQIKLKNEEMVNALEVAKEKANKKLEEEKQKLQEQINSKVQDLRTANKRIKDLEEAEVITTANHARDIAEKDSRISTLQGNYETLKNESEKKQKEIEAEMKNLKNTKKKEIDRLKKKNDNLKQKNNELVLQTSRARSIASSAKSAKEAAETAKEEAEKARDEAVAAANLSEEAKVAAESNAVAAKKAQEKAEKIAEDANRMAGLAEKGQKEAQKQKEEAEKERDSASEALKNERERIVALTKEKNKLETALTNTELERNQLKLDKTTAEGKFKAEREKLNTSTLEIKNLQANLAKESLKLKSEEERRRNLQKSLNDSRKKESDTMKRVNSLEKKIEEQESANEITLQNIKSNYENQVSALNSKHNTEKQNLIKDYRKKANIEIENLTNEHKKIMEEKKKEYQKSNKIRNIQIAKFKKLKKDNEDNLKKKINNLSSNLKANQTLVKSLRIQNMSKTITYSRNIANLRKQQKDEISQYKLREKRITTQTNNEIKNFKAKSIQNFRKSYISAQLKYRTQLQLKNSEIKRLKSGNKELLTVKMAQIQAENLAKKRKTTIINMTQNYKRANSIIKSMSAKNNSLKLKYASMLRKRNDLIKTRNNVITYYREKQTTLERNFIIEKAKNSSLQSIIRGKNQTLRKKDEQLKLAINQFKNIETSYRKLFENQKNQITKLKKTEKGLKEKTQRMNTEIKGLKDTIAKANDKIKSSEKKISDQSVIITELNAKQKSNLATISTLQSHLRSKIFVSQCSKRGYTATAGIKSNTHIFNGKRYIKEESIIEDIRRLNGKMYVRLINGKCMNKYSRPCPKPKVIFRRPKRSAKSSDLIKHNRLYIKYRCALIKRLRSRGIDARNWLNQRKYIKAKTGKFPRYPPFNTRMCGRGRRSISRVRNRCTGNCARYRGYINLYRSKIAKLQREYKFYQGRLTSYSRLFRRYNGTQRGTPAYNYKRAYITNLKLYRKTRNWPSWIRRRKARYRVLYLRYLSLLRGEIAKGGRYSRLISVYARNVSSRKRQINNYNNVIKNYQRKYPIQLR